jgi:glycosyltransferase involved in cell wall biosynthesis
MVVEPNGRKFSAAMLRLIQDAELRRTLGVAGRREVQQRFSAELMVENTIRVYQDVLKERQAMPKKDEAPGRFSRSAKRFKPS